MSAGLIVLLVAAGLSAAGAVAMFVTAVKCCECGARTPDLPSHYRYHHPTEECPR